MVSSYRPFDAVDGDLNTAFVIHADDKLSSGDDWIEVDLERPCMIDRYVVASQTPYPAYRPARFNLQRSDDGFTWTDVDAVANNTDKLDHYYGIPMTKVVRNVPEFRARFVRLYLPNGKPFTVSEFELYYTQGKTVFGPPVPAGEWFRSRDRLVLAGHRSRGSTTGRRCDALRQQEANLEASGASLELIFTRRGFRFCSTY